MPTSACTHKSLTLNVTLFFFNDTATTEIYTLSLHDALPISIAPTVTDNATSTLTSPTNGHWVDATHYAIDYTVADANVTLANVTFGVSGAQNAEIGRAHV